MSNEKYKKIKDIKRGDCVMIDYDNKISFPVSKIIITNIDFNDLYLLKKEFINSNNDIIGRGIHPIVVKNNKRCLFKNIQNIIKLNKLDNFDKLYNLQFDIEGYYYVENLKVDSVSPYHKKFQLLKHEFLNPDLFIDNYIIKNENDKKRNKPPLIKEKIKCDQLLLI